MLIKKYNLYDNEEFEKERKEYFVRDALRNKNNIQIQENILITKDAFGVTENIVLQSNKEYLQLK